MAEINNGYQGPAHLAVRIEVLRSGEGPGPIVRGGMFTFGSGQDMVWLRVTFYVAEREIFTHEVLVQAGFVGMWAPILETQRRSQLAGAFLRRLRLQPAADRAVLSR